MMPIDESFEENGSAKGRKGLLGLSDSLAPPRNFLWS